MKLLGRQLLSCLSALAWLGTALAEPKVTFINQDGRHRTVVFTPSAGYKEIKPRRVPAHEEVTVSFPHGWSGNWWSVTDGKEWAPGMLGEVTFNGYLGLTYFDVSAIVNPSDTNGVKMMWPIKSAWPTSGCDFFSCGNEYTYPDKVQTKTTEEDHLACTLGDGISPVYPWGERKRDWEKEQEQEQNDDEEEEEEVVVVKLAPSPSPSPSKAPASASASPVSTSASPTPSSPAKQEEYTALIPDWFDGSHGDNDDNYNDDNYWSRRHRYGKANRSYRFGNLGEWVDILDESGEHIDDEKIDWDNMNWDAIKWEDVNWDELDFTEKNYWDWLFLEAPRRPRYQRWRGLFYNPRPGWGRYAPLNAE
ncbi:hypothetical protein B0T21DRAFT_410190 [Apiosordaria backusii]|uniref:Uncharacterized protein n=1 Tax=Apiosordaria backusii TaxID=314023 RepID=A0AA40BT36_9PEZI|nr:hypothetical protein B0T21DRAFT_410190 [Apiosordaria backusii]